MELERHPCLLCCLLKYLDLGVPVDIVGDEHFRPAVEERGSRGACPRAELGNMAASAAVTVERRHMLVDVGRLRERLPE